MTILVTLRENKNWKFQELDSKLRRVKNHLYLHLLILNRLEVGPYDSDREPRWEIQEDLVQTLPILQTQSKPLLTYTLQTYMCSNAETGIREIWFYKIGRNITVLSRNFFCKTSPRLFGLYVWNFKACCRHFKHIFTNIMMLCETWRRLLPINRDTTRNIICIISWIILFWYKNN